MERAGVNWMLAIVIALVVGLIVGVWQGFWVAVIGIRASLPLWPAC